MVHDVNRSLAQAVAALDRYRREEGCYAGVFDAGVLFSSASIVIRRYRVARPSEQAEAQELALARYILACQRGSGLFEAWPQGPLSHCATRIATLALRRALDSNGLLKSPAQAALRERMASALATADRALTESGTPVRELLFQQGFLWLLSVLDRTRAGSQPAVLELAALHPPPWLVAQVWASPLKSQLDKRLYAFITRLWPLWTLLADQIEERTAVGGFASRVGARIPWLGRLDETGPRALVRGLLAEQDGSGAYFYSATYTELLAAALEGELERERDPAYRAELEAALERATRYLDASLQATPEGQSTPFLESDVWDSAAVGIAACSGAELRIPPSELEAIAHFVLRSQAPSGGFSYGRQSLFADCDTTGWVIHFLATVRPLAPSPALRRSLDKALCAAVDFMDAHCCSNGGFAVWSKSDLPKQPGTLGELPSTLFDQPTEDVTGRAMMGFGRVKTLFAQEVSFRKAFGAARHARLARLCDRAFEFLRARVDDRTGLWPARWTLGYLSGTGFVLTGLQEHSYPELPELRRRALATVLAAANPDGGYGEPPETDDQSRFLPGAPSTVFQTLSAVKILHACGCDPDHPVLRRALGYVLGRQEADGGWLDASVFTCFTGFYYRYDFASLTTAVETLGRFAAPLGSRGRQASGG